MMKWRRGRYIQTLQRPKTKRSKGIGRNDVCMYVVGVCSGDEESRQVWELYRRTFHHILGYVNSSELKTTK